MNTATKPSKTELKAMKTRHAEIATEMHAAADRGDLPEWRRLQRKRIEIEYAMVGETPHAAAE